MRYLQLCSVGYIIFILALYTSLCRSTKIYIKERAYKDFMNLDSNKSSITKKSVDILDSSKSLAREHEKEWSTVICENSQAIETRKRKREDEESTEIFTICEHKQRMHTNKIRLNTSKYTSQVDIYINTEPTFNSKGVKDSLRFLCNKYRNMWLVFSRLGVSLNIKMYALEFLANNIDEMKVELENLDLYYEGIVSNALDYLRKNTTQFKRDKIHETALKEEKETLGDIWFKKDLKKPYYMEKLDVLDDNTRNNRMQSFESKLQQILCIPEVYEDFATITYQFIKKTKYEIFCYKYISQLFLGRFAIIEYLHYAVNKNTKEKDIASESYKEVCTLKRGKVYLSECSASEVYKEVYEVLCLFYEYASPYCTIQKTETEEQKKSGDLKKCIKPENNTELYKLAGKSVIKAQIYLLCIVRILRNDFTIESGYKQIDAPSYVEERNVWTASPIKKEHYHVQYVNNSTHQIKTVHLPYYFEMSGKEKRRVCIHTINDIVSHIKKIFNIPSGYDVISNVYPFKRSKRSGKWSLIDHADEDRNTTVQYMESRGYNVVFYYIEEKLEDGNFVLMQFNGSKNTPYNNEEQRSSAQRRSIPLFLSPFMLRAAELGPYSINVENDITEKDKISVYKEMVPRECNHIYFISKYSKQAQIYINKRSYVKYYYGDFFIRESTELY